MANPEKYVTVKQAAQALCGALYSDSHITLDYDKAFKAVLADQQHGGELPNHDEIETLVMGDDEGEMDEALQERFPNINELVASFF